MSKVYNSISQFLNSDLIRLATEYGYSQDNIYILQGNENALRAEYPQTYSNLQSCKHQSDTRNIMDYGKDVVSSWILEDYLAKTLSNDAFTVTLAGADSERRILPNTEVGSQDDYIIEFADNRPSIRMELINDHGTFWENYKKMHLRDEKHAHMRNNQSYVFALALPSKTFAIFHIDAIASVKHIASHKPYGYKSAKELDIPHISFMACTKENVRNAILNLR